MKEGSWLEGGGAEAMRRLFALLLSRRLIQRYPAGTIFRAKRVHENPHLRD